ncbi:hypothetical protein [Streptomyces hundungensis]|uniref:hypothetical protein n=1 Tax=Streptomyces hundungensis TaxID=1077946 RepID=UPI000EA953A9|nr:hypothetical protein [Streptomyces hundungensis]
MKTQLIHDGNVEVRRSLAANPQLTAYNVAVLAKDSSADVRSAVVLRTSTRSSVPRCATASTRHRYRRALPWAVALHGDPDAMRRLAPSTHPLIRRSVARARRLQPDVVKRLAQDEDRTVRLFLAEPCDDAPAELLLEVRRWWDGRFSACGLTAYLVDLGGPGWRVPPPRQAPR